MSLFEGAIVVWSVSLDGEGAPEWLSSAERSRADAAINPANRRRWMRGRAALRHILGGYLEMDPAALVFISEVHGKPRLEVGPKFNLSHCDDVMLVAVSAGAEVGIDVEQCGRLDADWRSVTRRVFSSTELEELETIPKSQQPAAALRGWVRKEAYAKARGVGLAYGFSSFTVKLDKSERALSEGFLVCDDNDRDAVANWRLQDLDAPQGFIASLAFAGSSASISYRSHAALRLGQGFEPVDI